MTRRTRRYGRRKTPNFWLILFQIIGLLAILIAIVEVRDSLADGTSAVIEILTDEDIRVEQPEDRRETDFPGTRTDDMADPESPSEADAP